MLGHTRWGAPQFSVTAKFEPNLAPSPCKPNLEPYVNDIDIDFRKG